MSDFTATTQVGEQAVRCGDPSRGGEGAPLRRVVGKSKEAAPRLAPRAAAPRRAALLLPRLVVGGVERWAASLIQATPADEIAWTGVAVLDGSYCDPSCAAALSQRTPIHIAGVETAGRDADATVKHHRQSRDAVYAACEGAEVLIASGVGGLAELTADLDLQVVWVVHGDSEWEGYVAALNQPAVNRYVAVSKAAARTLPEALRVQTTIIENGVDVRRCAPRAGRDAQRRQWGFEPRHKLIGYVGRQSPEKNPAAALRATAELGEDCVAVYVGGGPLAAELRREAERLLPGRFLFVPFLPHLGDALAALDVLVAASHTEGFSLALVEAWLAGLPVVTTPVGAIPELEATHGPLAVVVPRDPPLRDLAHGVQQALAVEFAPTIERARRLAWRHWTAEAMAARWTAFLREIVHDGASSLRAARAAPVASR